MASARVGTPNVGADGIRPCTHAKNKQAPGSSRRLLHVNRRSLPFDHLAVNTTHVTLSSTVNDIVVVLSLVLVSRIVAAPFTWVTG